MRTPPTIPLGVLLAYHLVAHADDQIVVPRHPVAHASAPDSDGFMADERNTGFGVVVPFERVAEILNADALWERVARAVTARKEQYGRAKPAAT